MMKREISALKPHLHRWLKHGQLDSQLEWRCHTSTNRKMSLIESTQIHWDPSLNCLKWWHERYIFRLTVHLIFLILSVFSLSLSLSFSLSIINVARIPIRAFAFVHIAYWHGCVPNTELCLCEYFFFFSYIHSISFSCFYLNDILFRSMNRLVRCHKMRLFVSWTKEMQCTIT